ncbi:PH domain-containing protein [Frankia sp. EI5c]|uniref:PH domain-containing protein n=1 Tax=Frankia sp. EI5c TaxID=683316 RepID=UPI002100886E|nr:PH domain-containing protein [Frankia sp. EI5c]
MLRLLWRLLDWRCTSVMITSSRLVRRSGIITVRVQSIPMSKITDLSYDLDPTGRVLGYGSFTLETEGDHTSELEKIDHVPRPDRFYLLFCNSIFGGAPETSAAGD